jgi:hypothetical protein
VIVDGVRETQRQEAVRERGAIYSRLPNLTSSTHRAVFGATAGRVNRV